MCPKRTAVAGWLSILNQLYSTDTLGIPGRKRFHTDDSIQLKYYDNPRRLFDKAAMTLTVDPGCEFGTNSGVSVWGAPRGAPLTRTPYFTDGDEYKA
jgi:hypothetical protein